MKTNVKKTAAPEVDQPTLIPLEEAEVQLVSVPVEHFPPDNQLHGPAPSRQFIADVRKRGIIYPSIAVRKPDGSYDVRDGRNRIKTARLLKFDSLRTLVFTNIGTHEAMTITTAANAHRRSNPHSDLTVLRQLARDNKPESFSGLPASTIKRLKKLGQLEPEFLDAIETGQMSVATAEILATIEPSRRRMLLNAAKQGDKITSAMVRDCKRVQVADTASEFDSLLNAPMEAEAEVYVVRDPALEGFKGHANSLDLARQLAQISGISYRVYRLVEVA